MNKILTTVLAGIMLANSAGCATYPTYTRSHRYEKPAVLLKEDKTILKNKIKENLTDIKQDGYKIKAFVEEKSENNVKYDRVKSIKKVERIDTITGYQSGIIESVLYAAFYLASLGILSPPEQSESTQPGKEMPKGEREVKETKDDTEIVYNFEPKPNIPVKFSSKDLRFNNNLESMILDTDDKGCATATIKKGYPLLWRTTEAEVLETLSKNLESQIKDGRIRDIVTSSLRIRRIEYPIEIETVKKGGIIHQLGNPYLSEVTNDKNKLDVVGFQPDLTEAYDYVQNLIRERLEEKFLASFFIKIRDKETRFPIEGAQISFKPRKTPKLEELSTVEESIRKEYFVEGSEFFNATRFDTSQLLIILKDYPKIPATGIKLISNIGSVYDIEVTHPEYKFLERVLLFEKKQDEGIIEMISLGRKIRTEETREKEGGIVKPK